MALATIVRCRRAVLAAAFLPSRRLVAWSSIRRAVAASASAETGPTPRVRSGRSAGISDGNRDGNDGSRQRPEAAVNSHVLSHIPA
jgi:hypothetical protein